MRFSTSELAAHLGGQRVGPDVTVEGATIDSRAARPGQLYVPIVAGRDGHAFVADALEAGAVAYLTAQPGRSGPGAPSRHPGATALVVPDTAAALLALGGLARSRVGGVVGITGSVGKTTTKDLVAACLAAAFPTAASERSFNNELGVPLTLCNAPDGVRWVVLEMGARGAGHVARLAEVARPDVGIVTRVAPAHVEYFGDLDAVARAKAELVAALPPGGLAVLNFDDRRVRQMAGASACPVIAYSASGATHERVDLRAEHVTLDADLCPRFVMHTAWGSAEVRLGLHGVQQVPNALAAAAAALWCGVALEAVVSSLADVVAAPLRMEVHRVPEGPVLVVDCYNANPASTEAALHALAEVPAVRRLAVLGLMAELGDAAPGEHRRMAALAEGLGIELVGYDTDLYGPARVDGPEEAVALLRGTGPGDAVLVKGSRVARLEEVVEAYESTARAGGPAAGTGPAGAEAEPAGA